MKCIASSWFYKINNENLYCNLLCSHMQYTYMFFSKNIWDQKSSLYRKTDLEIVEALVLPVSSHNDIKTLRASPIHVVWGSWCFIDHRFKFNTAKNKEPDIYLILQMLDYIHGEYSRNIEKQFFICIALYKLKKEI